ncbi:hypothetical protein ACLOJK_003291 [Asimina triloba]
MLELKCCFIAVFAGNMLERYDELLEITSHLAGKLRGVSLLLDFRWTWKLAVIVYLKLAGMMEDAAGNHLDGGPIAAAILWLLLSM